MLKKEDFDKKEKVFSAKYEIIGKNINLYVHQDINENGILDESKEFKIFGYVPGQSVKSIRSAPNLEEVNSYIIDFCKDLELVSGVSNEYDLGKFLQKQSDRFPSDRRVTSYRVSTTTQDGDRVEMYVRWEQKLCKNNGGYLPMVCDVELHSKTYKEGQLHPAVPTEEDAKLIVDTQMSKLEFEGYYNRKGARKLRNHFKHEKECNELSNDEFYVFGNGKKTELSELQYNAIINILSMSN